MEIKENVQTVKVSMKCDKCKIGYMERSNNFALASYPPKYQHKCSNCGHVEDYTVEYPHLDVIPIKDENKENWDKEEFKPDSNDVIKTIARCLFECVEDLKDLGYSYEDFY